MAESQRRRESGRLNWELVSASLEDSRALVVLMGG